MKRPQPPGHQWTWEHPEGNKSQLDHIILRGKWINSLQSCRSYSTVELDSDHRILTAKLKRSRRTPRKPRRDLTNYDFSVLTTDADIQSRFAVEVSSRFEALTDTNDEDVQTTYDALVLTRQWSLAWTCGHVCWSTTAWLERERERERERESERGTISDGQKLTKKLLTNSLTTFYRYML